jgi:hypothetical protein
VARVAHVPHDGTEHTRERTSGELQSFGESLGAQLSGALETELDSIGANRWHGRPVDPWKLLIEAVRHDLSPSQEKEGSGTPERLSPLGFGIEAGQADILEQVVVEAQQRIALPPPSRPKLERLDYPCQPGTQDYHHVERSAPEPAIGLDGPGAVACPEVQILIKRIHLLTPRPAVEPASRCRSDMADGR